MTPPIVAAVRRFVDDDVRPVAAGLEHADAYPHALVARMRALGPTRGSSKSSAAAGCRWPA
jgi:hypothetical protein